MTLFRLHDCVAVEKHMMFLQVHESLLSTCVLGKSQAMFSSIICFLVYSCTAYITVYIYITLQLTFILHYITVTLHYIIAYIK